jgi:uncharacterized protein
MTFNSRFQKGMALGFLALSTWVVGACGTGAVSKAIRPKDPNVQKSIRTDDEPISCKEPPKYGEPLVVDWPSERRGDLEVGMKKGVVLVHFDCKKFKIVNNCSARGSYGFMGINLKQETISLKSKDEISANLPLGGVTFGASLKAGMSLDVSMAMIGVHSTTHHQLSRSLLQGDCKEATHFVQNATIGAFQVSKGTNASVEGSVSAFGVGVQGGSDSSKNTLTKDGDPAACKNWDSSSETAPKNCGSVLRLQLVALSQKEDSAESGGDNGVNFHPSPCPEGMAFENNKCVAQESGRGHQCDPDDSTDCERQCKLGHTRSCSALGKIYLEGIGVPKSGVKAVEPLLTACNAEDPDAKGCLLLSTLYKRGLREIPADETRSRLMARRASWIFQKECDGKNEESCGLVGELFGDGKLMDRDIESARTLLDQACDAGYARSCYVLAHKPYNIEPAEQESLHRRACNGGYGRSCHEYATSLEKQAKNSKNEDVAKDARLHFQKACDSNYLPSCAKLAILYHYGASGFTKDPKESKRTWSKVMSGLEKACKEGKNKACDLVGEWFQSGMPGLDPDQSRSRVSYKTWLETNKRNCGTNKEANACLALVNAYRDGKHGVSRNRYTSRSYFDRFRRLREPECFEKRPSACISLADEMVGGHGSYDALKLRRYLETACSASRPDSRGCWKLAQLYRNGGRGFEKDPIAAELWSRRSCEAGINEGCVALAELYQEGVGVNKDERRAFSLYDHVCKASKRRDRVACSRFEQMLADGKGTSKDNSRLFAHVETRCRDTHDADACAKRAFMYQKGIGVKPDAKKSKLLIDALCSEKTGRGCSAVGNLYETGQMTYKNPRMAASMYKLGCSKTYVYLDSCLNLANLLNSKSLGRPNPEAAIEVLDKACSKPNRYTKACVEKAHLKRGLSSDKSGKKKLATHFPAPKKGVTKKR